MVVYCLYAGDKDIVFGELSERAGGIIMSSVSYTHLTNFNADFRLEWKPDTLTNIIFRPNVSYGKSNSYSISESGTFNGDP